MDQNAASYNLGRMDQYLYPFYQKDIDEGLISANEAQELLDCLWVKTAEPCLFQDKENAKVAAGYMMFQNACCGGVDESGQDAVNALSYMMLQATMDVRLYQPSLSVRYNSGKNPDSFLSKVVELMSLGTGFPAFHNDEVGLKMMMDKGVPLKEAHNWNPCGCVETNLMGKMRGITDIAEVNLGSAVEFALLNGEQRLSGSRLFPATGDPRRIETFEAFKTAVKEHLSYAIRKDVEANHVLEAITWDLKPLPVASLTHKECIENAKDYEWGGAKYNTGNGIVMVGVADLINSLAAIETLIYEDQKLRWDELLEALNKDFVGSEDIRQMCLSAPKWGNDITAVDEIATEMFQFLADEVRQYNGRHGRMICGILPVTAEVPFGRVVGALPSGRKAWTPLADGISPTGGTDANGPTAVLKSVSKIPHPIYTSGTLLNMKLDPILIDDERGKRNLMAFLKTLCDLGVYHVQFNIISTETLKAAQRDPEAYRDLLVRVSGYTAYFVELGKEIQDEIIGRTTQRSFS
jgi:formate C-acetyltransferase